MYTSTNVLRKTRLLHAEGCWACRIPTQFIAALPHKRLLSRTPPPLYCGRLAAASPVRSDRCRESADHDPLVLLEQQQQLRRQFRACSLAPCARVCAEYLLVHLARSPSRLISVVLAFNFRATAFSFSEAFRRSGRSAVGASVVGYRRENSTARIYASGRHRPVSDEGDRLRGMSV
ncbi:hypothetical protein HPB51_013851 [Rhipicephalus microplus]|uniref:Uncharacterized protein n=1 Tax=Rhipicephalus microplus TaxID=6941 RepID=A0A9J6F3X1_RHIMP|nr:hypothetical protein HPB51_013851 [Rhipicephalus microplus]